MDPNLLKLFATKLNLSETIVQQCYEDALKEISIVPIRTCSYKMRGGKNKGLLCSAIPENIKRQVVINENDGKPYCKQHNKTINDNVQTKKIVTIKNNDSNFILNTIESSIPTSEKIETEKLGDFDAIKGTTLLINKSSNKCVGKYVNCNPVTTLDQEDLQILEEKGIEY
jgi:hypothetical protein